MPGQRCLFITYVIIIFGLEKYLVSANNCICHLNTFLSFQIPIQPDDDDLPPPDDALVTPTSSTSTSAGFSQRKQPSKKPQGSSDLASVLKEVWAADRAREDDVRKSVSFNRVLLKALLGGVSGVAHSIATDEQPQ